MLVACLWRACMPVPRPVGCSDATPGPGPAPPAALPPLRPRQMTPPYPDEHGERPLAALLAPDILALLDEAPGSVPAETEELHPADLADVAEAIPADRVIQL